jgi:hypothetical protein
MRYARTGRKNKEGTRGRIIPNWSYLKGQFGMIVACEEEPATAAMRQSNTV